MRLVEITQFDRQPGTISCVSGFQLLGGFVKTVGLVTPTYWLNSRCNVLLWTWSRRTRSDGAAVCDTVNNLIHLPDVLILFWHQGFVLG